MLRRLIVTGANGTGKSHVASRLGDARPDVPVISFDAIKLTGNWEQKPRPDIDDELARTVAADSWILEGGPSLLDLALPKADAVIWLDPPERIRLWRLAIRPWRNLGRTRPELPAGNVDWPVQQYRFAFQSLGKRARFRDTISERLEKLEAKRIWHCRTSMEIDAAIDEWRDGGE